MTKAQLFFLEALGQGGKRDVYFYRFVVCFFEHMLSTKYYTNDMFVGVSKTEPEPKNRTVKIRSGPFPIFSKLRSIRFFGPDRIKFRFGPVLSEQIQFWTE